jgi:F-type H+-transporting ATPase subunit epsilon
MPIRCEIVSQDRMVWEGNADMVTLPGTDGEMGILPHHAPLLSTLRFAEVQPDIVTILADAAENIGEIDVARAQAARDRAEEILKAGPPPDTDAYLAIEAALRRSNLRLDAVRRYRQVRRDFGGSENS